MRISFVNFVRSSDFVFALGQAFQRALFNLSNLNTVCLPEEFSKTKQPIGLIFRF